MGKKSSFKGKKQYSQYKTENRAYKNKIAKMERYCKENPKDIECADRLEKLKKNPSLFKARSKPLAPGSNPPSKKIKFYNGATDYMSHVKTAGEQLSELLGISMPKVPVRRKKRAAVRIKKRKDVKKS